MFHASAIVYWALDVPSLGLLPSGLALHIFVPLPAFGFRDVRHSIYPVRHLLDVGLIGRTSYDLGTFDGYGEQ